MRSKAEGPDRVKFRQIFVACILSAWIVVGCQSTSTGPEPAAATAQVQPTTQSATAIAEPVANDSPRQFTFDIVDQFPHDPEAFTQGLIYVDGLFYEGTGLYGESTLRTVDPETGAVLSGPPLPDEYFGEGITLFDGNIYQLTWKSQTGFVVDAESFEVLRTFTYPTEGWGLTHDGEQLIMSDGTNRLTFLDPETLEQTGQIEVFDGDVPVIALNELEYIDGQVYANVWQTDDIAIIDVTTGQVAAWIDLTGLLSRDDLTQPVDVLNGIAFDAEEDRLFVTGKLWPTLFEINLIEIQE